MAQEGSKVGKILGVTANDTRTLAEKLEELRSKNLSTGQVMEVFGERAGVVANILINSTSQLKKFTGQMSTATGTARTMADVMTDNLAGAGKRLDSAFGELAISMGTQFLPIFAMWKDGLADIVNAAAKLMKATDRNEESLKNSKKLVSEYTKTIEVLREELSTLEEWQKQGGISILGSKFEEAGGEGRLRAIRAEIGFLIEDTAKLNAEIEKGGKPKTGATPLDPLAGASGGEDGGGEEIEKKIDFLSQISEMSISMAMSDAEELIKINKEKEDQIERDRKEAARRALSFERSTQRGRIGVFANSANAIMATESLLTSVSGEESKKRVAIMGGLAFASSLTASIFAIKSVWEDPTIPSSIAKAAMSIGIAAQIIAQGAITAKKIREAKFQDGGIVGGSSVSGDNVPVRVNSREMILNQQQQARLFNIAQGRTRTESTAVNLSVGDIVINGPVTPEALEQVEASREEQLDDLKGMIRELRLTGNLV